MILEDLRSHAPEEARERDCSRGVVTAKPAGGDSPLLVGPSAHICTSKAESRSKHACLSSPAPSKCCSAQQAPRGRASTAAAEVGPEAGAEGAKSAPLVLCASITHFGGYQRVEVEAGREQGRTGQLVSQHSASPTSLTGRGGVLGPQLSICVLQGSRQRSLLREPGQCCFK